MPIYAKKIRILRRDIDDKEEEIEMQSNTLKDKLQAQLKETVTTQNLFTIRWSVI